MPENWTEADDAMEEVHEIRRRIWAQFDNDPYKVVAYYMELDKQLAHPMARSPQPGSTVKSAAR